MTAFATRHAASPGPAPAEPAADPARGQALALHLWRPTSTSVVIRVAGELDATTAPRLHELLAPRLSSTAETVVLDLSGLDFLGVAGLEMLAHASQRAESRSMSFCLVDGPVCVDRALRAAGLQGDLPTFTTVEAAVERLNGRSRESGAARVSA